MSDEKTPPTGTPASPADAEQGARRLRELAEGLADPDTHRRIKRLGLREGARCFEPGCGGGSIARWLRDHVGPTGHVLAVDIDTRFIVDAAGPTLEVRTQDIVEEPPPEGAFDFVHTRFLLQNLPRWHHALARLAASLKPGGWILLEEQEIFPLTEAPQPALRRAWSLVSTVLRGRGIDVAAARKMPDVLRQEGLTSIGTEVSSSLTPGGSPGVELLRITLEQTLPHFVGAGLLTAADVSAVDAQMRDPHLWFYGPMTVAVWGQRPLAPAPPG